MLVSRFKVATLNQGLCACVVRPSWMRPAASAPWLYCQRSKGRLLTSWINVGLRRLDGRDGVENYGNTKMAGLAISYSTALKDRFNKGRGCCRIPSNASSLAVPLSQDSTWIMCLENNSPTYLTLLCRLLSNGI